jgi:hypothetical protein
MHTEHIESKTYVEAHGGGVLVVTRAPFVQGEGESAHERAYANEASRVVTFLRKVFCDKTLRQIKDQL